MGIVYQLLQIAHKVRARDFAGAEAQLRKAVEAYPGYAEAWQELGDLLVVRNRNTEAREAFLQAIASDHRYAKPRLSLARLAATERDWQGALDSAESLLELDAFSYPQAYYFDALANYYMGNREKALEQAQQAVRLDKAHVVPWAEGLLGTLYSDTGDYSAAAEQFRNCIRHAQPGMNLDEMKRLEAAARAAQATRE